MQRTVVFVHGTGVRGEGFVESLKVIREAVGSRAPLVGVRGCYWGEAHGARLNLQGSSIPRYNETKGGTAESEEDRRVALWAVLYLDPWHELRLLGLGAQPRTSNFKRSFQLAVRAYVPSRDTARVLEDLHIYSYFQQAHAALIRSPEFNDAAATAEGDPVRHRAAVARALLAHAFDAAERHGVPTADGAARDLAVAHLLRDLSAQERGVGSPFKKAATATGSRMVTWEGRRHRGLVSDRSTPAAGDILRYQVRGGDVRRLIAQHVEDAPGQAVTLIGHSLGGIACFDLLASAPIPKVDQLVTVGSQVAYLREIDALASLRLDQGLPDGFPRRWLNVWDERDLLSYVAEPVFPGHVEDLQVASRQPFPQSHSAYWDIDALWEQVIAWMG